MTMPPLRSRALLASGLMALLAGLWAAVARIGWDLPALGAGAVAHGPLMIAGFLGTLVNLERAVALDRRWVFAAPALAALGALLTLFGLLPLGPLLIALGSLVAIAAHVLMLRLRLALYTATMLLGIVAWAGGNLLWLAGLPIFRVAPWWAAFLVLFIAGERLELNRILQLSVRRHALFAAALGIVLAGLLITLADYAFGVRVAGTGLLWLALWLLAHDIARRNLRAHGLTRYIAACLMIGYIWLAVGGALAIVFGGATAGVQYDAMLHAIFLGFVFSMIFAHAPIILPAILLRPMPYRPFFYLPLALLHLSLLLRVGGDVLVWIEARQWGGLLNAIAVLWFLANTAAAVLRANRRPALSAQTT